jgi:AcrR family transcriptional regulator
LVAREATNQTRDEPRERIVATAYELFSHRGVRDVGVDEVISRSGVAKATLYRHFRSKTELVLAFLERREQIWTATMASEARRRGATAEEQLLAIFDVFDDWFHGDDFEACSFINTLLEMGQAHPAGQASIRYLRNIRTIVEGMAEEAGLTDPAGFAQSCQILMRGATIAAAEGHLDAAQRAKAMARLLISDHRDHRDHPG